MRAGGKSDVRTFQMGTIKHKKGALDAKRGKLFTKLIREMTVAARMGGGDPDVQPAPAQGRRQGQGASNMPADNIKRAIQRGTGELEGVTYEEVTSRATAPAASRSWSRARPTTATAPSPRSATSSPSTAATSARPAACRYLFKPQGYIAIAKDKADRGEADGAGPRGRRRRHQHRRTRPRDQHLARDATKPSSSAAQGGRASSPPWREIGKYADEQRSPSRAQGRSRW